MNIPFKGYTMIIQEIGIILWVVELEKLIYKIIYKSKFMYKMIDRR